MSAERTTVGPALVFGDNVNTDVLHPSRFFSLDDRRVRAGFLGAVAGREAEGQEELAGRLVVAGRNFGVGSSRETGARVFVLAGIQAVVAASFARIFHRNLLNLGLPAIVCPGLAERRPAPGEIVTLEIDAKTLSFGAHRLGCEGLDPYWEAVLAAGGLSAWLGLEA